METIHQEMLEKLPSKFCAKFKGDFAYRTTKYEFPDIVDETIVQLRNMERDIKERKGQEISDELNSIYQRLDKLKEDILNDKPLTVLQDDSSDVGLWNAFLEEETKLQSTNGSPPTWYSSPILYTECYFYRRIMEAVWLSPNLRDVDPFITQKRKAFTDSLLGIEAVGTYLSKCLEGIRKGANMNEEKHILNMFQICLWGNKCDLAIPTGSRNAPKVDPLSRLEPLRHHLISNQTDQIWEFLSDQKRKKMCCETFHIILDNSGFELFTDLCLCDLLISFGFCKNVTLHCKSYPWLISDVTERDLEWTLEQLLHSNTSNCIVHLAQRWKQRLEDGSWKLQKHFFWTLPHDFNCMPAVAPELYEQLTNTEFLIIKGDLNHRKLTGDLKWCSTTPFPETLRTFLPTSLCTIRCIKCDVVVGLKPNVADSVKEKDSEWTQHGDWGVIQCFLKM